MLPASRSALLVLIQASNPIMSAPLKSGLNHGNKEKRRKGLASRRFTMLPTILPSASKDQREGIFKKCSIVFNIVPRAYTTTAPVSNYFHQKP
jgi:hypothetical protein